MKPITARDKAKIERALRANRFTNIRWTREDTVECSHISHKGNRPKGITDLIRGLGYQVPCGGIAGYAYSQVYKK